MPDDLKRKDMLTTQKHQLNNMASWFAALIILILLGRFGIPVIEWILTKLYEFFIQRVPLKI
jgi:hypothetical protein